MTAYARYFVYYIGIDPGFTGAVAVIDDCRRLVEVFDTPVIRTTFMKRGKSKTRSEFDIDGMNRILRHYQVHKACIELVNALPGQGVTSMFRFGHGLGVWEGLMKGLDIPYIKTPSVVCKRKFGLIGTEKSAARAYAKGLFPDADLRLAKHSGRADALCMAEFVRRLGERTDEHVPRNGRRRAG